MTSVLGRDFLRFFVTVCLQGCEALVVKKLKEIMMYVILAAVMFATMQVRPGVLMSSDSQVLGLCENEKPQQLPGWTASLCDL